MEQEENRVTQTSIGKTRLILAKMQISLHLESMVLQLYVLDIAL